MDFEKLIDTFMESTYEELGFTKEEREQSKLYVDITSNFVKDTDKIVNLLKDRPEPNPLTHRLVCLCIILNCISRIVQLDFEDTNTSELKDFSLYIEKYTELLEAKIDSQKERV